MNKQELLDAIVLETKGLPKDWNVGVHYDIHMLMTTIAALQLAMRHPKLKEKPTYQMVRHITNELMAAIPADMPAMRELARMGDNPEHDEL